MQCYGNQLTILDLSNNTKFETLLCHSNQLTEIDISQLTALITFRCSKNELTELDVSQNINLEELRAKKITSAISPVSLRIRGCRAMTPWISDTTIWIATIGTIS